MPLLIRCWSRKVGHGVAIPDVFSRFRNLIEKGKQLVELTLVDRIVFVVVATSTADRQTQPDGGGRLNAINDIFDAEFFRDDSPFGISTMIAVESRSNHPSIRGRWITERVTPGKR